MEGEPRDGEQDSQTLKTYLVAYEDTVLCRMQAYDDHTARQRMEWRWPKGQLYLLIGEPD
jgi:hypothetical protein|tara:strand:- start:341 stop:520 length:180 start_codon:yes stop_codon:yes gene_type:complete